MKLISFLFISTIINLNIVFAQNNSHFISQTVPSAVLPGTQFPVSITFQNTGTTTWKTSDSYHLGSQSPQDNTTWGVNRLYLPDSVLPEHK